ncbi:MAG: SPW repeat protein [Actinobacteria bacterium]|nr:SPW repeat protein [Actinomycetota bacterium]
MLRQGFVPFFVHGVIEYAAGALFVAAPFLLGFDSTAATAVSIVIGIAILVVAASTDSPTGLSRTIPVKAHVALDLLVAAGLVAAPFLFGFSDETNPTAFFIVLGVVHLLLTIATRFLPAASAA